ncbi:HlyD family type I secretion periplasmic adaptor subunit [Sphingobium terrigena]|uniref:Membrane fusion protein (MFP) family protein n=1 Tax=Sphingobium terrigena TaxID=2304063 RepID=A0A418YXA3_9SPHN|nr:HlyD family type I secretion periplasmic adaptor subunit [Sphingobium terrigena]RJG57286.1 HlyD family type I secretion periplasmic adaptor subunit [Sphingobium terrigena]
MTQQIAPPATPMDVNLPAIADPNRDIKWGLTVAAIFFVGFLGWAAFARLDAAAYATGSLIVSGQRQSVQHRDGGVIGSIHVKEGQRVERGRLLISLAAAEVQAQERALTSQTIRLLAQRARLEAELMNLSRINPPREFAWLKADDKAEAALAMKLQQSELIARASVLRAQRDALLQRVAQSGQQGQGYKEQAVSAREQLRLIDEQIAALKPVAAKGFVSETRIREMERIRALLQGQRGQYAASVAQAQGAARENEIQVLEAESSFRERTGSELRDVELRLGDVLPKWRAARDQLARTEIRAPATGAIVGMTVFTPGGVISPGQKLMDIVPERQPLRVQIRLSPDDSDDLSIGQELLVKFSGLHERTLPHLKGQLTRLSADSFTEESTGQSYFTGEAEIPSSQLQIIQKVRGPAFALRAGMPVQILIPLRKRTALDYMLEPLIGSFWSSFREH